MKSLYLKITLWILLAFFLSVSATFYALGVINRNLAGRTNTLSRMVDWQFAQALGAYHSGGVAALDTHLKQLNGFFSSAHYLLDAATNRDLLDGQDRSDLVSSAQESPRFPRLSSGRFLLARTSPDGHFRFLVQVEPPFSQSNAFLPLGIVFLFLPIFSYGLFRYLASPLRQLSLAVDRFGQGDLSARVRVSRSDEIGALGARYNQMAERIQTLLASERRLLESVSHELRSPLARMQFALAAVDETPQSAPSLARLRREIDRLGELVSSLLAVTRAEGDPESRARETLDLDDLVRDLVADSRIEAEAKSSVLNLQSQGALPIHADRELLRRAVENVIRNAIRYSPSHSPIEVSTSRTASEIEVQVRDYGPGVPEEMLEKIFKPFFRVDSSRTAATGGIGLGLAIAQRALALHNGRIVAENANPGLRVRIKLNYQACK